MRKKVLLVDGNSLLFRAYFATAYSSRGMLQTKDGTYTNAIFSFANMLTSILNREDYYDVKVAFDKGKHTFRHDKMEDYKAGRKTTPPELVQQFPIAREFLQAANISYYEMDDIEADDLIGSMAKKINEDYEDYDVDILTSDQDMYQLINATTSVLSPMSGTSELKVYHEKELFEKWGVTPHQVPDLKGLMGDKSDNLKGVAGIGEKKAQMLIQTYGSIEGIYQNLDQITGALHRYLVEGEDSAFLTKEIATIQTNVYLEDFGIYQLNLTINPLLDFFKKYEMFSLVRPYTNKINAINHEELVAVKVLDRWDRNLEGKQNAIFVESLETNYHVGHVLGVGISNEHGNFYLDFLNHQQSDVLAMLDPQAAVSLNSDSAFQEFLNSDVDKGTYDLKRTVKLLENSSYAVNFDSFHYDLASVGYLLNPSITSTFQNHIRLLRPDWNLESDEAFFGKGAKLKTSLPLDQKASFVGKKAYYLGQIREESLAKLGEHNQIVLYEKVDFPLIKVLKGMEDHGVLIDRDELEDQTTFARKKVQEIESNIKSLLGDLVPDDFNVASPKQIKELLYDKLNLPNLSKGSTSREALEQLISADPVVPLILEYRKWAKLDSTYLSGFGKYIHEDNRVYTIYNQNLTATGRLSSQEPNLQNISVRDEEQKTVRKIFIADPGFEWMSFDYSQIELRVLAQMANEKHLLEIFAEGGDVHEASARKIFNLSPSEAVSANQRRVAKIFNFGILYGLSDYGLAKDLNISMGEAKDYITKYYETFPAIQTFKDDILTFAKDHQYVETMTHRIRYVPELKSKIYFQRQAGERMAINMPVQGTAADILKIAMINIDRRFHEQNLNSYLSSQIHDEIIFAVQTNEKAQVVPIILDEMTNAFVKLKEEFQLTDEIKVALTVSESSGANWFELK